MTTQPIILTGATGYLGSNLYDAFLKQGKQCYLIGRESSLKHIVQGNNQLSWDLSQPFNFSNCQNIPLDSVYVHCASVMSKSLEESWNNNILATKNLLEVVKERKTSLFVYISTGGVYNQTSGYCNEFTLPSTSNSYSSSKLISEELVKMYARELGFNSIILRLYFPFGGKNIKGVFRTIPRNIMEGKEIIINNHGAPLLNPLHISEIEKVILKIIKIYSFRSTIIKTYNLCGDEEVSFQELVNLFSQRLKIKPNLKYSSKTVGNLLGDNTIIKSELGWLPKKKMIKNFIFKEYIMD